jgi:hypothetical protein
MFAISRLFRKRAKINSSPQSIYRTICTSSLGDIMIHITTKLISLITGVRDKGQGKRCFRKTWKFGQMLGKIKKIRADLSENMLNSGYFITILHKNSGKLKS